MFSYPRWKSIVDVVAALVFLICCSPVLCLLCVLIKLEDPAGPAVFRQERVGKNNQIFTLYKLRSMKVETHQNGRELTDEERMLKVGYMLRKTSLDELPQLWNIVKGEMSFIGPRPLLPEYLPYYNEMERQRHKVKPGISGWAQVNGRNRVTWEEKFALDVEYVTHMSAQMDLRIVWLTIQKIFKTSEIIEAGHETTQDFSVYRSTQTGFQESSTYQAHKEERNQYG